MISRVEMSERVLNKHEKEEGVVSRRTGDWRPDEKLKV
jgi:hypothetical protein